MDIKTQYKDIFGNSVIGININHNEALNVFNGLTRYKNLVLINCDLHSDIYIDCPIGRDTIANWVNYCISKLMIKEYFWVISDYVRDNDGYKQAFESRFFLQTGALRSFDERADENSNAFKKDMYFDFERNELLSDEKINHINDKCAHFALPYIVNKEKLFKTVIYRYFADDLPDFSDKQVILSVDADYFCNTGYDTGDNINNKNITENELINKFEIFLDVLLRKNIRPAAVSLTLSPLYTPERHRKTIMEFFNKIKSCCD